MKKIFTNLNNRLLVRFRCCWLHCWLGWLHPFVSARLFFSNISFSFLAHSRCNWPPFFARFLFCCNVYSVVLQWNFRTILTPMQFRPCRAPERYTRKMAYVRMMRKCFRFLNIDAQRKLNFSRFSNFKYFDCNASSTDWDWARSSPKFDSCGTLNFEFEKMFPSNRSNRAFERFSFDFYVSAFHE